MRSSRNTALDMIQEYKETVYRLAELTKETKPLYERAGNLRKYLATYKCRGIITADDLPYRNWESIQAQVDRMAQEDDK